MNPINAVLVEAMRINPFKILTIYLLVWNICAAERLPDVETLTQTLRAYNFEASAFDWFESEAFDKSDPFQAFIAASASYWIYQSDRIELEKRRLVEKRLTDAIAHTKKHFKSNKKDSEARFLYGVSRCNRSRFHVEESNWFKAYLDAREGLGILRQLVKDDPDYVDAYFALGVAECFLSDAPAVLKPLARLMGFKGSAKKGVEKLQRSIENGDWTRVEAQYYLAYYYYSVVSDGNAAAEIFTELREAYPLNPMFGYFLGRSYQIAHRPLEALEVYRSTKTVADEVGSTDIYNWCLYRVGNILLGEHMCEDALVLFEELKGQLNSKTHHQEYFYRLPYKIACCYAEMGDIPSARRYLEVIQPEWDSTTNKLAKKLSKELDAKEVDGRQ